MCRQATQEAFRRKGLTTLSASNHNFMGIPIEASFPQMVSNHKSDQLETYLLTSSAR